MSKIYTMPLSSVVELLEESADQTSVIKGVLKYMFSQDVEDREVHKVALLCESLWANVSLSNVLEKQIEATDFSEEHTDVLFEESSMFMIQGLVTSRHHASIELNSLSVSTSLH